MIRDIDRKKNTLRQKYRLLRKSISNPFELSSWFMTNYINNILMDDNLIIAAYIPIDGEIDVLPLMKYLQERGHIIVIPVISRQSKVLKFQKWNIEDNVDLIPDIMIVPMISFDKKLNRLGFGKGYYDRTINFFRSHFKCRFIGVAYNIQYCYEIPINSYDQALDCIVTENRIYSLI
ncbi:5-formyltetrahydrofolate cyclo-ligase [Candidatus Neoehrlichia procyonis]|uniref:5-formyltetrahydrofolate cyclo-ligase n=1 Tax=Candidatus Neoehrlichia procyonis str. RAC413 TaxID=1359163 RepID=A0A0F3NPQ3_9RICK|nr:5-formyltetrahydrofolate cyclo-ligase [Candidatus Neoehrlichia lotoris]KJV68894.1 5-formyltetrahydrofolate cyclo-ligase [Candidatus Neoehrlichia lotoris str. RAC413]